MKTKIKQAAFAAVLAICLSFIPASTGLAQNGSWTTKAPIPTPRYAAAASAVDGIIYVIGGLTKASYPYAVATVEAYDPATDTWTTKTEMPTPRQSLAACAVNGKIYAICGDNNPNVGNDARNTVEEYDPKTDSWQAKAPMPYALGYFDGCVLNGKIYIAGGGGLFGTGAVSYVCEFDPATNSWDVKKSLPSPRAHLALRSLDGYVYAMGGAVNPTIDELSLNEAYDPSTDSWSSRMDMPTARAELTTSVVGGKIYAIGGTFGGVNYKLSTAAEAYDPLLDCWIKMTNMPTPRFWHSRAVVDEKIYIIGGTQTNGSSGIVDVVEMYDPSLDLGVMLEDISIDKGYAAPGSDSVCVSMIMHNEPTGLSVYAEIQSPDQTPVDKLPLYDDGNHNDGGAGDNLYANVWPVLSLEEQRYFVDMRVTKVETDTLFQHMDNMASFTTIGPLVYDSYTLNSTTLNPGDRVRLELNLKNTGAAATATNIKAELICLDASVTVTSSSRSFKDIAPGVVMPSTGTYGLTIADNYTPGTAIPFRIDISSDDCVFWSDTFSVTVESNSAGRWTTKTSMPKRRGMCAASQVDGIIYVIGGITFESWPDALKTVEAYDPTTDTWTTKADMPTPRHSLATCCLNEKIYAIGGSDDPTKPGGTVASVEVYDPVTDSWQKKEDLPNVIVYHGACSVNGTVYVVGGMKDNQGEKTLWAYDSTSNSWTRKADMPTGRCYIAASVANGKIYVMGGAPGFSENELATVEEYDPSTDTWTPKTDMPTARLGLWSSELNGKIYAIGGSAGFYQNALTTIEEYDPATDTWRSMADMLTPRLWHTTCTANGKIYVFGGVTNGGNVGSIMATVEEFTPPTIDSVERLALNPTNPNTFILHQNYPNPFNPITTIQYELSQPGHVTVSIYNLFGQHIRTLVSEEQNAGVYTHAWDARDAVGNNVGSGIYLYRLEYKDILKGREAWRAERKMVLLK